MDILESLLAKRGNRIERGVVTSTTAFVVTVQTDTGMKQIPQGLIAVNPGDQVRVQGEQLLGKRRPQKAGQIYQA